MIEEAIIHHVKEMGESEYTDCGLPFINTGLSATQFGKVTCEECSQTNEETKS